MTTKVYDVVIRSVRHEDIREFSKGCTLTDCISENIINSFDDFETAISNAKLIDAHEGKITEESVTEVWIDTTIIDSSDVEGISTYYQEDCYCVSDLNYNDFTIYYNINTGEVYTIDELIEIWKDSKTRDRYMTDTFENFLNSCTGKNGMLQKICKL